MKGRSIVLRPLAVFTFTFFVISCSLFTADTSIRLGFAVVFSVLYAVALIVRYTVNVFKKWNYRTATFRAVLFFLAGAAVASCLAFYNFDVQYRKYSGLYGKTVDVEGVVTDVVWDGGYSGIYKVALKDVEDYGDFLCVLTGNGGIKHNSKIKCSATFSPLLSDGSFDEFRYYLTKRTVISAESYDLKSEGDAGPSFNRAAYRVNSYLSEVFVDYMEEDEGGFAAALLFGNKEYLSKTLNRDFTRLGVSHALAISGMHLTVICAFIATMLRSFGKRTVQTVCVLTVVFYMFITGLAPAVTRSGVMYLFYMCANFLTRGGDRFTNLGFSVFAISIVDTYAFGDIGLQLSFGAVLAIFLFTEKKKDVTGFFSNTKEVSTRSPLLATVWMLLKSLWDAVVLTVIILLFMLPIEWLYFGSVCLLSPLVSPLFSLLTSILLWALPLFLIISPVKPLAEFFAVSLKYLIGLTEHLASVFADMRNITLHLSIPFGMLFAYLLFGAILLFCLTRNKARIISAAVGVLLTIALVTVSCTYTSRFDDKVYLSMLQYKSYDGIFLASDGKGMIIDIANGYSGILNEGLARLDVIPTNEVDAVLVTHIHSSTAKTLKNFVLKNTVRRVYLPYEESSYFDSCVNVLNKYVSETIIYKYGESVVFGDSLIRVCEPEYIKRSTQPCLRVEVEAFDSSFVYLGATYGEACSIGDVSAEDFIWFGIHGPKYKNSIVVSATKEVSLFASESVREYINSQNSINDPCDIILGNS